MRLAEGSVARKKQCPALDFEQLKLRLGQLTASKKTKPDLGVEIPDVKELAQTAGAGFSTITQFVCPLAFQQPLSATAPNGLTSMDGAATLSANLAPSMPFLGQTSSLESQEQLCPGRAHAVELTELSQPIQPLPSASISDSGKAFAFPSAPGLPGFPPINTQLMLDPHQLYAYRNAIQSQLQLNPVDLLLLSAIQQGQHTASYNNNLYRQLLQQTYANSSPPLGHLPPSLVVNPAQFHPMFGSMLYDWPMAMMVGGLPGLVPPMVFAGNQPSVPDATQKPISDVTSCSSEAPVLPSSVVVTGTEATTDEILSITENKQQSFQIGILDQKDPSGSGIQQTIFTSGQILTSVSTATIPYYISYFLN